MDEETEGHSDCETEADWEADSEIESELLAEADSEADPEMEEDADWLADSEEDADCDVEPEAEMEYAMETLGGNSGCPTVAANELALAAIRVGISKPKRLLKKRLAAELKSKATVTVMGSLCRSAGISTLISSRSTLVRPSGSLSRVVTIAVSLIRSSSCVIAADRAPSRAA